MECVSEACKIQCSAGLEKDSRPKWCLYFKEPTTDTHLRCKVRALNRLREAAYSK
jgi:septin family protein